MPVVRPARRCSRKPRSSPLQRSSATPIAATGSSVGLRDGDEPADERQPQPAVVASLRAEGEHDVAQLPAAVEEAAQVARRSARCSSGSSCSAPRGPRSPRSTVIPASQPNPAASGKHGVARRLRQVAAGRRAAPARRSRREPDQAARRFLRDPEAAALLLRERGDRQVAVAVEQRPRSPSQVGVAEQEVAGRCDALAERQRLPLAAAAVAGRRGAPAAAATCAGCVARAVVGDDHLRAGKLPPQRPSPSSRSAPPRRARRSGS